MPLLEVGVTGGIAAGKSEVTRRLAAAGCHTLDLDRVAHAVMAPGGSAYSDVVAGFGREVLARDGQIDRKRLGGIVFADAAARGRLNALVHPRVREEERRRARELATGPGGVLVSDAALLVESGQQLRYHRLIVVDVDPDQQLRRLMARDRIDEPAARARIDAQMPLHEKRRFAHVRIDSSPGLDATRASADRLARQLLELARVAMVPQSADPVRLEAVLASAGGAGPLSPLAFADHLARRDAPELPALAALLRPGDAEPWYAGAAVGCAGEELMPLLAAWALARRGDDAAFLAAGAFSLARLHGAEAAATADAMLLALAAAGGAGRGLQAAYRADAAAWSAEVERWTGLAPRGGQALRAALDHPGSAAQARRAAGGGRRGSAAAALVALTGGGDERLEPGADASGVANRLATALTRDP